MLDLNENPIVFYNVENLFDTIDDPEIRGDEEFTPESDKFWDDERYQEKLINLSKALTLLQFQSPLAFGLAEIENRQVLEDLIQTPLLRSTNYKIIHFDSEDRRGMDCAFIYDSSLFEPNLETKLIIRMDDDRHFRTRDILHVKGKILEKHELHFFVNHWPSRREGQIESEAKRIAAATILRREIDKILDFNPTANILVMGDFNDTPVCKSTYQILRAKGQHEQQPEDLINLLIEEHKKGLGTHVHDEQWMVFDQMMVSQGLLQGKSGLEIEENNAFILRNPELLHTFDNGDQIPHSSYSGDFYHGGFSDHLPIYLTLKEK